MRAAPFSLTMLFVPAVVTVAVAQIDPHPDGLGIYFDLDGTVTHRSTTQPLEQVTAYLLATNLSALDGIAGFEGSGRWEGDVLALGTAFVCDACFVSLQEFAVGCGTADPVPWSTAIRLATITFLVASPESGIRFFLGPYPWPTLPGHPCYATGSEPIETRPFYVSSGSFDLPVATVNEPPPAGGSRGTWGAVKSMFD